MQSVIKDPRNSLHSHKSAASRVVLTYISSSLGRCVREYSPTRSSLAVIKSFEWAMNGIRATWREEKNFRIEILIAVGIVATGAYLSFSKLEWAFITICIAAVLAAEMINTAIEDLCNKVEPNTDPVIGKIKDMMGGFVLIVVLGAVTIGAMVFSNHF